MSFVNYFDRFDENYFKRGQELGISCYSDFKWMPTKSFPVAITLKNIFGNKSILDYGCGFGYVVKALRLLEVEAYGYDGSTYAISQAPEEIKDFVTIDRNKFSASVVFIKDVLEHAEESDLDDILTHIVSVSREFIFAVIPLGDNDKYRIAEYEKDITHLLAKDEEFWLKTFVKAKCKLINFSYRVAGIKDNWMSYNPFGNGFFLWKK